MPYKQKMSGEKNKTIEKNLQNTRLMVFTAPSGAGKTTIVRHLLSAFDELDFSISATTREKRKKEKNGKDYYFISVKEFQEKIENDEFVEWEEVYENQFYGTLKSEVKRLRELGKHVIFDIDVQGAISIKKVYGDEVHVVFIKPPSKEVLFNRLKNRKTESKKSLERRINKAIKELEYENKFDAVLLNDKLDVAFEDAEKIVRDFCQLPVEDKRKKKQ